MSYRIGSIDLFVRETPPGRMAFALGTRRTTKTPPERLTNPLGHVRLVLRDDSGGETFGCSGDRLSVRWLDKRAGRSKGLKLRELVALIEHARDVYLENRSFDDPFRMWKRCHTAIVEAGLRRGQEDLTSSFASALLERALVDAVCRLAGKSVFRMVHEDKLGLRPDDVHPELRGFSLADHLSPHPVTRFHIRHTVGIADPLVETDLPAAKRVNDGLPETLQEYIRTDGVTFFKVKISGDVERDLRRLEKIWSVLPKTPETVVTLDANESYADIDSLTRFVKTLEREVVGLFQHLRYIEQPLPRALTLDPTTRTAIRRLAEIKPLLIDEADGRLHSYREAYSIGYAGTSHKNCKGFFKSLLNRALVARHMARNETAFLSGEDLQNLPIVPLHQDFATLSILGLTDCERNGHHYNHGLSLLSQKDRESVARHHRDLYVPRGDRWFLNVRGGKVECASLQCVGFGVQDEPDWQSMTDMRKWLQSRYPG